MASYRAGEGYREIDSGAGRTCESAGPAGSRECIRAHRGVEGEAVGGVARAVCAR